MYTLKGIFPEPKKEPKKNFIKENMKQLKFIQGKPPKDPKFILKPGQQRLTSSLTASTTLGQVKSSPSSKSGKVTLNVAKTCASGYRRRQDIRIKKGDMAEFLKRKELRQAQTNDDTEDEVNSNDSSGRLRDIGCQTIETNLSQRLESAKLTMLYPREEDSEAKLKASGDSERTKSPSSLTLTPRRAGDDLMDEKHRSKLNSILEKKDKDPYLPSGYQKGVLPKYLRERKEQTAKELEDTKADEDHIMCPPGHVTLPDNERKETLRMLRNSFAELVSELNKMPVKTDTLRMRNRKMELEKQLAKLEEGIKVFSRPKVFVKIGE
ncbi:enkurin domain-containing protein 1-like isoform X1 [Pieris napi]|uniref:enkurin domain-containing protein 1-like isoform X1 n=1 Tax=Pieris napi TaxID=78633 RepID=UPI001FB991A5|nr:enkurin domain-containing protein 1-like isoform X1 [Pieris napi]